MQLLYKFFLLPCILVMTTGFIQAKEINSSPNIFKEEKFLSKSTSLKGCFIIQKHSDGTNKNWLSIREFQKFSVIKRLDIKTLVGIYANDKMEFFLLDEKQDVNSVVEELMYRQDICFGVSR